MTQPKLLRMMKSEGQPVELYFYDERGESFFSMYSATDLKYTLDSLKGAPYVARIDSAGGNPYVAVAMHTVIKDYPGKSHGVIDGMAASSMSVPACAFDTLEMRTGSQFMIHNPTWRTGGTAEDFRNGAQRLEAMQASAVDIYVEKSGKSPESIRLLMSAETWMPSDMAKSEGFADKISKDEAVQMSARESLKEFKNVPRELLPEESELKETREEPEMVTKTEDKEEKAGVQMSAEDVAKIVRDGIANAIADLKKADEPSELEMAVKAETDRVKEISTVCMSAGFKQDEINAFIDGKKSLVEVQREAIVRMQSKHSPASGGDDSTTQDEDAKYRDEYKNAGVEMNASVEEYINVRREEDGLPVKTFSKAGE